jgi:flagella basal body P-ring formation protein FlgA
MRRSPLTICLLPFIWLLLLNSSSAIALSWSPETVLKAYLKDNYPWTEIEIHDLIVAKEIPDEQPIKIGVDKGPPGKTVFVIEFKNGVKITATASVKALDWIVMSGRAFRKSHYLQKDDVYVKLMDITRIPKGAIKSPEQVIDKLLTRSIPANIPLVDNMIADTPVVKRGSRVTLLVESSSFTITTTGETKENGYVGSNVRAVNLASKKVISGLLVDENTIKVEF